MNLTFRVRITPGYTSSADGLQDGLTIEQRKCRYRDENEKMKIFSDYTRAGCRFECMLDNAYDVCKCIPWNYPYIVTGEMEICDMFGAACYEELMGQVFIGEQCDCPEDCDEVSYDKFETNKDLNVVELCADTTSWVYKYMRDRKHNREGYDYRSSIDKVLNNPYVDQSEINKIECENMVKYDLAIITMEVGVSTYSEFVREEATSIGKYICGLF